MVSLEGLLPETDLRRHPGAYSTALQALEHLRRAGACFGFAAVATAANVHCLASEVFLNDMIERGCVFGYFTEYVPCGPDVRQEWILEEAARAKFRQRVLELRNHKPIVIVQFPHDEYGSTNRCTTAGKRVCTSAPRVTWSPVLSCRSPSKTSATGG
ncbi:MAG: hypothetical protein ACUVX8_05590 [Candidatus Zipacnadales bacterium]